MVEVAIRNNGQLAITVPRDSEQLVSVSSITAEELARHGHDLTQEAVELEGARRLLRQREHPARRRRAAVRRPRPRARDVLTLGAVFAVPSGHNAAAYLVVLNSFTVARRWLRPSGRWSETRKLVVPDQEAA